ncbi:MAG: septum formation initiator family protein [Woeseiaceae bacterium]|nr:septum formation initiator family protein [Woeseiaceae bacterium]
MRTLLIILAIAATAMQGQLWLADDGFRKTRALRAAVQQQHAQNQFLRDRNTSLEAEVINLKQGTEAAEERARTDLGMIGKNETFFQIIPADESKIVANADNP